jgi:hypothetical protein
MPTRAEKDTVLTHGYLGRPTAGAGVSNVDVYLLLATVR